VHSCDYLDNPSPPFPFVAHAVAMRTVGGYFTKLFWLYEEYRLEEQFKEAMEFGILREVTVIFASCTLPRR
jgi:hypothetical protein